ncbi:MAG: MvaI/BcnI restriction endonuclease family protein [Runella slithyformis]|nr:MAG: MvaI/BcnI restriction endonuclease family protein [Runella slithyformis]TAF97281.1 MAG: MvaI/BcnI restriction endonuclease family protein [Runella sp.]TAG21812.1 MAG: MvaI/BcnI restriction endonuclease family protein [Cytophagales bacterium]TAG41024.1 MAG: MvaI/BcnI restriction endonuclease family protein [Cytophagia bacterium]TAF29827.1 MAG: MvaI/BcnI restriction endonuclease family protein [Runella slithyformis]
MNLQNLQKLFIDNGCRKIYVKKLSPNDNSKNQVYLGGSFEVLNIFPVFDIKTEEAGDWNKERFKALIHFSWVGNDGNIYAAPNSQLILYPKYPEVRFSGFLSKCQNPPSDLMTERIADRLLFLSVTNNGLALGYVAAPESTLAQEFDNLEIKEQQGVFKVIELPENINTKERLIAELRRIHLLNWIDSKSLTKNGLVPCTTPQCGGYTLEAELGIARNGLAAPDFLGWEIKNLGVKNLKKTDSAVITLFTPEPTHGIYKTEGAETFLRTYGYADKLGREDRINFGGIHKAQVIHHQTKLQIHLVGFDAVSGKIRNTDGRIALLDSEGHEAAAWSFASLLLHWNTKHNQACYVPSISDKVNGLRYKYDDEVILGLGTDFQLFLQQMALGNIYYDPAIKMERASTQKPEIKKRSQFRITARYLKNIYKDCQVVSLL